MKDDRLAGTTKDRLGGAGGPPSATPKGWAAMRPSQQQVERGKCASPGSRPTGPSPQPLGRKLPYGGPLGEEAQLDLLPHSPPSLAPQSWA